MRDDESGGLMGGDVGAEKVGELLLEAVVDGGEGFIEEEDLRGGEDSASEGDALLFAAAERFGETIQEGAKLEEVDDIIEIRGTLSIAGPAIAEIVEHGEVGKELVVLEKESDAALFGREKPSRDGVDPRGCIEMNGAGFGCEEACDEFEGCRFTRTRGADQSGEKLRRREVEVELEA